MLRVVSVCVCLTLLATSAQAVPIRYTLTGLATGSLVGTSFTAKPFTVILETDTDYVTTWSGDGVSSYAFFGPGTSIPERPATIQLEGLPLATFTTPVEIFLAQGYTGVYGNPFLSFGRPNSNSALPGWAGMLATGLGGVNLASEFGTSLAASPDLCSSGLLNLFTDQGTIFTQSCGSRLTSITAEFLPVTAPVPIPAAAWLMTGALGTLVWARRTPRVRGET